MGVIKEYRKTSPIHAVQWTGLQGSTSHIINWAKEFGVDIVSEFSCVHGERALRIPTLEGPVYASVGDYIAKGVQNEFWPIKPDIMARTYEEVQMRVVTTSDPCSKCQEVFQGTGNSREVAEDDSRYLKSRHESSCTGDQNSPE